ncbi:MAG: hypothetical protein AB1743_03690 [Actinomycetota bacterium]
MILKIIYTIFLGTLLVIFVGVGIETFYPEPKYPTYPIIAEEPAFSSGSPSTQKEREARIREEQTKLEKQDREFRNKLGAYNSVVFLISLAFAISFLIVSLLLADKLMVIADGLLLGGMLTLIYSVGRGMMASDKFRFTALSISLVIALLLGYIKFIHPLKEKPPSAVI